ncbi:PdaC/SigV domain-containing protein [Altererythrobacter sp. GH1-8]|uniref:DUF3298 and DUF4163 domain-containing protein n=1 Tax=Altererythrobacter sp. GH1-8 TaxID=3349333 RepID=UPI00374DE485
MATEMVESRTSDTLATVTSDAQSSAGQDERKPVTASTFKDEWRRGEAARTFEYNWPREVNLEPELAAQLRDERQEQLDLQIGEWTDQLQACPVEYVSCRQNSFSLTWQVVANLPRFLSLSNGWHTYTGGAHGIYGRGSLIWDRQSRQSLKPLEMFMSAEALDEAVGEKACAALNRQRSKRRGEPVPQDGEWPNQCVPVEDAVVFVGSSNGETFDRIGLYYGPYLAASYAEGDFEFTFPVTSAVIEAVKPEYRSAFAVRD